MRAPILLLALLSPVALAAPAEHVKLEGKDQLALDSEGDAYQLRGPASLVRMLGQKAGTWTLVGADHKPAMRATCTAGTVHVTDARGTPIHDLQRSADGFAIVGADKKLLFRVKVKADKFNVYDDKAQRLFHGKAKPDGFGIRDAADAEVWKLKGISSLQQAAYFGVPLEFGELTLLWKACP